MDYERYPLLKLAYEVGKEKGVLPCVMNAANEAAVELFLNEKITFVEIEEIVINTVQNYNNMFDFTVEDLINIHTSVKTNIFKLRG
jgi:1-deoxy-D-xylulose-5-phosphate reductoisomerase